MEVKKIKRTKTKILQTHKNNAFLAKQEKTKIMAKKDDISEVSLENDPYIYVYGIIKNKNIKLNIKGLNNKQIKKIDFEDISALVSFYPILHPALKEEEAMKHAAILKKLAKKTTMIPMSFGTVFKDKEILETVLSKSYQTIKETIKLINGKIELGVKVVKNQLDEANNEVAFNILESLNKLSIKNVKGDSFSDRLLLNHSFLVEKNKFSKFSDKIANLESKYDNLKFLYTGPWPPYSFVNIRITGN